MSLAIGRQRAREGHSRACNSGQSHRVSSSRRRAVVRACGRRGRSRPLFSTAATSQACAGEAKGRGEERWRCHRRAGADHEVGPRAASQRIPRSSSHHDDFIPPPRRFLDDSAAEVRKIRPMNYYPRDVVLSKSPSNLADKIRNSYTRARVHATSHLTP